MLLAIFNLIQITKKVTAYHKHSIFLLKITRVDMIEDAGKSLNPEVDIGQIEGALVMGLGLWTTEKIVYDKESGELLTKNTWVSLIFLAPRYCTGWIITI